VGHWLKHELGGGTATPLPKRSDMPCYAPLDNHVTMLERKFGYFPQRFQWRGQTYTVTAQLQCWTRYTKSGPALKFRVQTEQGTFDLTQTLKTNEWSACLASPNEKSCR